MRPPPRVRTAGRPKAGSCWDPGSASTLTLDLPASGTVPPTQVGANFVTAAKQMKTPVSLQEDSLSLLQTSKPPPAKMRLLSQAACFPLRRLQAFPSRTPLQGQATFS